MKKLLTIICAIAMLFSMAVVASAEEGTEAIVYTKDGGIKVTVIDDFSSYTDEYNGVFGDAQYTFDGEKLVWDIYTGGWCYDGPLPTVPSSQWSNIEELYNNAQYIGFQVKNVGDVAGAIAFEKKSNWMTQIWKGDGTVLVGVDGEIVDAEMVSISAIYRGQAVSIPAGFDGWVFIPFTAMRPYHNADVTEPSNALCVFEQLEFCGTCVEGEEEFAILEIDNLFLAESLDVDTTLTPPADGDETATEEPGAPTDAPATDIPATDAPTDAPTAGNVENPANNGWIVWVAVAAVVVIAVIVVIIVAGKKKAE
ncbi:MAG: hypothetical protein IKK58_06100 [Clostridia bacterium]|nr:hypothetical protein [Clostridia bacterium]